MAAAIVSSSLTDRDSPQVILEPGVSTILNQDLDGLMRQVGCCDV